MQKELCSLLLFGVQFSSVVQLCPTLATPWTRAHQASLSITNSQSPPKPMSIVSVMHPTISSSVIPFSSIWSTWTLMKSVLTFAAFWFLWWKWWWFSWKTSKFKVCRVWRKGKTIFKTCSLSSQGIWWEILPLPPPPCPPNQYSEASHQMNLNQGYIPGLELGKNQQERIYPLTAQDFRQPPFH